MMTTGGNNYRKLLKLGRHLSLVILQLALFGTERGESSIGCDVRRIETDADSPELAAN